MSDQIVVRIARMPGNKRLVELQRAPNLADFGDVQFFECDPSALPDLNQPDKVCEYGQVLLTKLTSSNEMVKKAVDYALGLGPAANCPIYFNLTGVSDAEQFFWETLCDGKGKFLAWDKRWQVGRMADSPRSAPRDPVPFQAPVKIMAIISALGVDAIPEWDAFYEAVIAARVAGLPIRVFAAIGDENLSKKVSAIIDDQLTSVSIVNQTDLLSRIDEFGPHLLHFFCHGSTAFGQSELQLATLNDSGTNNSSVKLAINDLLTNAGIRDAWLVTLNCCEGGAATKEVHSLTQSLVSQGVYAAVGMMEAVDALDAHEFCKYFYPAIFTKLCLTLQSVKIGNIESLDWLSALHYPRVAIKERHKNEKNEPIGRQWALPVLYVQPEPLRVRAPLPAAPVSFGMTVPTQASHDEDLGHEETIEGLLSLIPPDKLQDFLQALQEVRAK